MNVILNGKQLNLEKTILTVEDLLHFYQLENRIVIVEINKKILNRELYHTTILSNGDSIELIHFVGGG